MPAICRPATMQAGNAVQTSQYLFRFAKRHTANGIEPYAIQPPRVCQVRVCQTAAIAREAQVSRIWRGSADWLRRAARLSRGLFHWDAPDTHSPATIAAKINVRTVRGPDRIPVE